MEENRMQESNNLIRKLIWPGLLAALLVAAAALAQSSSPDVGLVTKLTGKATYWNKEEKKPGQVQAFMKVRQGDQFKVAKDSAMTLLFFASGRQETWKGPAALKAGDAASEAKGGKNAAAPEVKMMPTAAIKMIAAAPFIPARVGATPVMEKAPGRSGAIQTMAPVCKVPPKGPSPEEARKAIKQAQVVYRDLKKKAGPGDFTPELYFLGVMAKNCQYAEMNKILDKLLQKKPGDPALNKMKSWVRTQSLCGG
jgi:hypothetical protein